MQFFSSSQDQEEPVKEERIMLELGVAYGHELRLNNGFAALSLNRLDTLTYPHLNRFLYLPGLLPLKKGSGRVICVEQCVAAREQKALSKFHQK